MAPAVLIVATVVSAAVAAYGAYQQGQFQKASSNYQAAAAQQDAQVAQEQAAAQAEQDTRNNYLRMGQARAAAGASGAGDPLDIFGDIASQGELQKQNDIYQGKLKARGSQETATIETATGKAAATGGTLTAGATLIGGAAQAYQGYSLLTRPGSQAAGGNV